MAAWVASGTLLLLLLAAAAYCNPVVQGPGPLQHSKASKPGFTPELSVSGARPRSSYQSPVEQARLPLLPTGDELPDFFPDGPAHSSFSHHTAGQSASDGRPNLAGSVVNTPVVSGSSFGQSQSSLYPVPYPPSVYPQYQPGELFRMESTFEHGDDETETESQGSLSPPGPFPYNAAPQNGPSMPQPPYSYGYVPYPFDYNFLTGQYPVGTISHYSTSFERGRNYNQDVRYEKHEDEPQDLPYSVGAPQNLMHLGHFHHASSGHKPSSRNVHYQQSPVYRKVPWHTKRVGH
ncbi:uncharacterized protein LOC133553086 [Nerophis ophidion]|uniref:uncharacterized protein LOC133553086 n=1 Tax=Nerophis ophidion TaxID=159077 RepID=UPI002AE0203F|nr:uncharacterized protein LOC133553086 [Nerophis ophidion]